MLHFMTAPGSERDHAFSDLMGRIARARTLEELQQAEDAIGDADLTFDQLAYVQDAILARTAALSR